MLDLSIVIVNYNTKDLTLDCIDSILVEDSPIKKEIIVVDNNSTDGSLSDLDKLSRNGLITLIKNVSNLGFAKANNAGIKKAKGEYVLLLNSDTKVKKLAFKKLLDFAQKTPSLGAVGPKLLNADGSPQDSAFRLPTIRRAMGQYWFGEKGLLDKYTPKGQQPIEVESLVMAAFLITPLALNKVGMLNEKYFMYFEDLDYCRSLRNAGLSIYYVPNAEVIHYHGASGKNLTSNDNQWKRLIPSSKKYHGLIGYYIFSFILWSGQKLKNV